MSSSLVTNSDYLIDLNSGANTLSIAGTVAITGNLSVSGNSTLSGNILGDRIQNGTTSIDIQTANGNANISIGGISNIAVFATTGEYINGLLSVTGNITANNGMFTNIVNVASHTGTLVSVTGNVTANNGMFTTIVNTASFTGTLVSVTGNITGGNLSGTSITGTLTTGTQSAITSVGTLTNMSTSGNANVTGNVNSARVSATGNITAGNILTGGLISVAGNITAGNLDAVNLVINSITSDDSTFVTIEDGVDVNGEISATGNITGNYFIGNGSQLTGISGIATLPLANGTSDIDIATANGNVTITANGSPTWTFDNQGDLNAPGGVFANVFVGNNLYVGTISSSDSTFFTIEGGVNFEDSVNVNGEISATGNVTGGNVLTAGVGKTGVFVTGTIPVAAGVGAGARAFVTDADSITFGNLYVGGSGNAVPVYSNGTSWYVG